MHLFRWGLLAVAMPASQSLMLLQLWLDGDVIRLSGNPQAWRIMLHGCCGLFFLHVCLAALRKRGLARPRLKPTSQWSEDHVRCGIKWKGPVALSQFSATLQYTCAFKFWVRNKMINLNNLQI